MLVTSPALLTSYQKKQDNKKGDKNMSKKVTYNVIYQVCGQVTTDIPDDITTREEAIAYLEKNWKNMPFPKSAEYICDSEELDTEGEITITPNNGEE